VQRLLVLLRGASDVLDVARSLADHPGTRAVTAYVELDAPWPRTRHGLPIATSFDAMIDVAASDEVSMARALSTVSALTASAFVYRVDERRPRAYPRDWADGAPTPGLFVIAAVGRATSASVETFAAAWRDRHGPLALEHHAAMWDYRQDVVLERRPSSAPAFDGIARLGFPSVEAFETGFVGSQTGARALAEDTATLVSHVEVALLREIVLWSNG